MTWQSECAVIIHHVHQRLRADATLKQRQNAVDEAKPYWALSNWPYKAWLKVRKQYLKGYGYRRSSKKIIETPMEQLIRKSQP